MEKYASVLAPGPTSLGAPIPYIFSVGIVLIGVVQAPAAHYRHNMPGFLFLLLIYYSWAFTLIALHIYIYRSRSYCTSSTTAAF